MNVWCGNNNPQTTTTTTTRKIWDLHDQRVSVYLKFSFSSILFTLWTLVTSIKLICLWKNWPVYEPLWSNNKKKLKIKIETNYLKIKLISAKNGWAVRLGNVLHWLASSRFMWFFVETLMWQTLWDVSFFICTVQSANYSHAMNTALLWILRFTWAIKTDFTVRFFYRVKPKLHFYWVRHFFFAHPVHTIKMCEITKK